MSDTESLQMFVNSQGESEDETAAANCAVTSRFLFLRRVHQHLNTLDRRRRSLHLRRLARRERRRNNRLLMLERRAELRARMTYTAQLRYLSNQLDEAQEAVRCHIMRHNNIMQRTSAIVQLNSRLMERNRYLQDRLNRIYLTLRPAVHFNNPRRA